MEWAPEIEKKVQEMRRDYNRRHTERYSPLQFLEENKAVWED